MSKYREVHLKFKCGVVFQCNGLVTEIIIMILKRLELQQNTADKLICLYPSTNIICKHNFWSCLHYTTVTKYTIIYQHNLIFKKFMLVLF